jgi:hypothetical protein
MEVNFAWPRGKFKPKLNEDGVSVVEFRPRIYISPEEIDRLRFVREEEDSFDCEIGDLEHYYGSDRHLRNWIGWVCQEAINTAVEAALAKEAALKAQAEAFQKEWQSGGG